MRLIAKPQCSASKKHDFPMAVGRGLNGTVTEAKRVSTSTLSEYVIMLFYFYKVLCKRVKRRVYREKNGIGDRFRTETICRASKIDFASVTEAPTVSVIPSDRYRLGV